MTNAVPADVLKSFIDRVEALEEQKRAISEDIKEVYAEAKNEGFSTKVMRNVVKLRRMDKPERIEMLEMIDLYLQALGDLKDTPLGEAAVDRDFGKSRPKAREKMDA